MLARCLPFRITFWLRVRVASAIIATVLLVLFVGVKAIARLAEVRHNSPPTAVAAQPTGLGCLLAVGHSHATNQQPSGPCLPMTVMFFLFCILHACIRACVCVCAYTCTGR